MHINDIISRPPINISEGAPKLVNQEVYLVTISIRRYLTKKSVCEVSNDDIMFQCEKTSGTYTTRVDDYL